MSKQDAVVVGERDTHIAQNLRQARETLGLTQPDLATRMERLGHPFSQATISRIESGNRRVTLPEAADLATLLHITLDTFLDPPGNPTAVAQRRALRDHATELEATLTELAHTLTRAITAQIALLDAIAIISEFTPEDSVAPFTRTEADALITQYGPLTATRTLTDIQTTLHHAAQHAPWDTFTRFQDALEPTPDFLDHYGVRNDFINAWKPPPPEPAMTSTTPNLSDPIVTIEPVLVDYRTAANILAISESTLRNTIRQYNLTPRYVGTKPLLVTELRTYAQTLPEHPTHH